MRPPFNLALITALLLAVGCGSKSSSLAGKWDTSAGLVLVLESDGRFSLGTKQSGADFSGTWKLDGTRLRLETTAMDGKPIEEALRAKYRGDTQDAELLRDSLSPTLEVSADSSQLIWKAGSPEAVFTRTEAHASKLQPAEISAGLRLGMPVHEVMAFFRLNEFSATGSPRDPGGLVSEFEVVRGSSVQKVRAVYRYHQGKPGLESIEVLEGQVWKQVPLGSGAK